MSAKTAIREFCLQCVCNSYKEVRECILTDCPLWPFREGGTIKGESKQKSIRRRCEDCIQTKLTGKCKQKSCPLFSYREGHRPVSEDHVKKTLTPEQLKNFEAHRLKNRKISSKPSTETPPFEVKTKRRLITCIKKD